MTKSFVAAPFESQAGGVMMDLNALERAAEAGGFEAVSHALGVEVNDATLQEFDAWCSPATLFGLIRRALVTPFGVASLPRNDGLHLHARRLEDEMLLGIANDGGAEPWSREPLRLKLLGVTPIEDREPDDAQQFLEAIAKAPHDDDARRVYADFLEEHGEPQRAELIRLQLANPWDPRVAELLTANWRRFSGELVRWTDALSFDRGLVDRVSMTAAEFAQHGERVFAKHPVETLKVESTGVEAREFERIVDSPPMSRVRQLTFIQRHAPPEERTRLAPIAKGKRFDSLRTLSFIYCGASAADWESLLSNIDVPRLDHVIFSGNHTHPAIWRALAKNPALSNLTAVNESISSCLPVASPREFVDAMHAFAASRSKVNNLTLIDYDHADDATLAPLFASSSRLQLSYFVVTNAKLTDQSLRAWRDGGRLGELVNLEVGEARFTARGLAEFLEACPPKLRSLSLKSSDQTRWTHDALGELYEALLRVPEGALRDLALPHGRRGDDPLWREVNARFRVSP
ncbi:MAG: TIGR02996 domain-containing protein [Archangium sp.]